MKKAAIVLVLVAVLAGVAWWTMRTPPRVGEDFAALAPAQQQERRDEAKKLQTEIRDLAASARKGERKPFELEITESQLNTLLQDNIRSENAPVRDLRAGITADGLALQGQVNYKGLDAVVTMNGNLTVAAGKLGFSINSLQIGGFPAPSSLREKAESQVAEKVNKYLAKTPGTIQSVETRQGMLVIRGITD